MMNYISSHSAILALVLEMSQPVTIEFCYIIQYFFLVALSYETWHADIPVLNALEKLYPSMSIFHL